ncbi:unnamed protein product [Musa acuminata subsp. burmannicoides]
MPWCRICSSLSQEGHYTSLCRFPDTAAREFNTKKFRRPPLAEASLLGIETNHMTREVPSYYHRKDH